MPGVLVCYRTAESLCCCPTGLSAIEIVCPINIATDQPLTFSSRYTGGVPANVTLFITGLYRQERLSPDKERTRSRLIPLASAGQTVRASLSMGGYNSSVRVTMASQFRCRNRTTASLMSFLILRNDEKARLDNFGIELQHDPTATAGTLSSIPDAPANAARSSIMRVALSITLLTHAAWINVAS